MVGKDNRTGPVCKTAALPYPFLACEIMVLNLYTALVAVHRPQ